MLRRLFVHAALVAVIVALMLVVAEMAVPHLVTLRDVGASFTQYDPVVGKRLKPDFHVLRRGPEFTMAFSTNTIGTRGAEPPRPLERPVVFFGDSFTMGYGVSDGEEFPALIGAEWQRRLGARAPYVLNHGIGNSGNGFWLRHMEHTLPALKPRLVVLQVLQNDYKDNLTERFYELDPKGQLVENPIPPPSRLRAVQQTIERVPWIADSNLLALARQAIVTTAGAGFGGPRGAGLDPTTAIVANESEVGPGDELTLKIVETAIARCQQRGWPVLVLSVALTEARREALSRRVNATGAPLIEFPTRKQRPELFYQVDGHWNAQGHAEAARVILARIEALRLLPAD